MKVVVIGGTGLIGSQLIDKLKQNGYEAIAASPSTGVNTLTGEGLDNVLKNADIVVDVTNSPSFEDKAVLDFFTTSTKNLLNAEKKANVKHHITLSIVGIERLPESGYFKAKIAQEKLIKEALIPYTIVRATQFFEFLDAITHSFIKNQTVYAPSALIQPIASKDVVEFLFESVLKKPKNETIEIAGPKAYAFTEIIEKYLKEKNEPKKIISDDQAKYYGGKLTHNTLVPHQLEKAHLGNIDFRKWFQNAKS